MTRKVCRRKHYALVDPIQMAILGAAPAAQSLLDEIRTRNLSAIESFAKGVATPHDWRTLADAINVAQTMGEGGIGPEALPACEAASEALSNAHGRYSRIGRLGMTGPELQSLREMHEWHDLQIQSITRGEFERWIARTSDRIRSAHPSLKVFINPRETA